METLPTLPPSSTEIAKLSTVDIAALVTITFMRKNRETSENNILFTANEIQKALSGKYNLYRLTIGDLDKAFLNGVSGIYGDVYEIGYVAFTSWIDAYLASDEYLDKIHKSNTLALPQKSTKTEEEIEKDINRFIIEKFNDYKTSKELIDRGCICYKYLVNKSLLKIDASKKWDAYYKAKDHIEKNRKIQKKKRGNAFDEWKEKYIDKEYDIVHTAKLMLVKEFFDKVIQYNKEDAFKKTLLA